MIFPSSLLFPPSEGKEEKERTEKEGKRKRPNGRKAQTRRGKELGKRERRQEEETKTEDALATDLDTWADRYGGGRATTLLQQPGTAPG